MFSKVIKTNNLTPNLDKFMLIHIFKDFLTKNFSIFAVLIRGKI
jgi:hypothetical protein